jgi:hypothetical protein
MEFNFNDPNGTLEYLYLYLQEINSIIQKKKNGAADRAYVDSKEGAAKLSCIYNRTFSVFASICARAEIPTSLDGDCILPRVDMLLSTPNGEKFFRQSGNYRILIKTRGNYV